MNKNPIVYKNYLHDLGIIIKEEALESKKKKKMSKTINEKDFNTGYMMGFHRVISLMQQQAEAFNIDLKDISLNDIDPYKDLL